MPSDDLNISVQVDPSQRQNLEEVLAAVPRGFVKAATVAIGRTVDTGATNIRRRLAPMIGVGVRTVGRAVRGIHGSYDDPSGAIRLLNFNVPAIKSNQDAEDGVYAMSRRGPIVALPNRWFVATMPKSGHVGQFVRRSSSRLPINEIFVASPRKQWESAPAVASEEIAKLGPILAKNMESQVTRLLSRQQPEAT